MKEETERAAVLPLIERATNSTAADVDPRLLKAIKSSVRSSDSELRCAAQTLLSLMIRDHSQQEVKHLKTTHAEEMSALRTVTRSKDEQISEFREELPTARTRIENLEGDLDASQLERKIAAEEIETLKAEASVKANEVKTAFIKSEDFKAEVADKAFPDFELGFESCKDQFVEAGLLPADKEDFPDFEKAIASLPAEDEEEAEKTGPPS